jgi:hypothetical protein
MKYMEPITIYNGVKNDTEFSIKALSLGLHSPDKTREDFLTEIHSNPAKSS